jgi:hypothetical protein
VGFVLVDGAQAESPPVSIIDALLLDLFAAVVLAIIFAVPAALLLGYLKVLYEEFLR